MTSAWWWWRRRGSWRTRRRAPTHCPWSAWTSTTGQTHRWWSTLTITQGTGGTEPTTQVEPSSTATMIRATTPALSSTTSLRCNCRWLNRPYGNKSFPGHISGLFSGVSCLVSSWPSAASTCALPGHHYLHHSQNHLHNFHLSKFISTSDDGHMRAFCCGNAVTGDVTDKAKLNFHCLGIGDVVVYKPPGRSQ